MQDLLGGLEAVPNQCLRLLACSFVMLAADARAVNDPNDLCPLSANPCQIDGIHSITDGAIFNFAGRDVRYQIVR